VLHPQFTDEGKAITKGLGASPGAAVGKVYFTADEAEAAWKKGEDVILVRNETSPDDVHGMMASKGILTARGGLVSHAAVVARGWGTPAVVGAEAVRSWASSSRSAPTPSWSRATGCRSTARPVTIMLGKLELSASKPPAEFETILKWADQIRKGKLAVRANADTGEDAANARALGAEGIGLCRTEHMFLAPDRLPIVRDMILANTPKQEEKALEKLRECAAGRLRGDPRGDGRPARHGAPARSAAARVPPVGRGARIKAAKKGKLSKKEQQMLEAAESWAEHNPMIGTRGVRLGVIKPGLYAMQVRALLDAAAKLREAGKKPIVEIMIPLTVTREEMALARSWVQEEIDRALAGMKKKPIITIGTMIETPRAAIRADEIAEVSDFFSFGTNDLTQLTFGFSRDDVESRMMPAYLEQGLLKRNPFDTIDQTGVGDLVRMGAERGRKHQARPQARRVR
jgi:pyruvate, orthophosphate dikinase